MNVKKNNPSINREVRSLTSLLEEDKRTILHLKNKIEKRLLENPSEAKKAALILENWLHLKK